MKNLNDFAEYLLRLLSVGLNFILSLLAELYRQISPLIFGIAFTILFIYLVSPAAWNSLLEMAKVQQAPYGSADIVILPSDKGKVVCSHALLAINDPQACLSRHIH